MTVKRNAQARLVAGYSDAKTRGDFYYLTAIDADGPIGFVHRCPCGCDQIGSVYWKNPRPGGVNWQVSGPLPKAPGDPVTFSLDPSIGFRGNSESPKGADGFHWHGYLRNGVFEEC